jgi:hypothetical protein
MLIGSPGESGKRELSVQMVESRILAAACIASLKLCGAARAEASKIRIRVLCRERARSSEITNALLAATHSDSRGNSVIADASHDMFAIQPIAAGQLLGHQSDFHI